MPVSDRPDDDTIKNDANLDIWLKRFEAEQARKSGRQGGSPKYRLDNWQDEIPTFRGPDA